MKIRIGSFWGRMAMQLLLNVGVFAQNGNPGLAFDAATVKIAGHNFIPGVTGRMSGGPGTNDPTRIFYSQVRLFDLLMKAWDFEGYQIEGPAWIMDRADLFTVTATMPRNTTAPEFHQMLQKLLIESFRLSVHHEIKPFPGYSLTIAPGGPKLAPSADPDAEDPVTGPSGAVDRAGFLILPHGHGAGVRMNNGIHARFQNYTISEFVAGPYLRSFIQQATGNDKNHLIDRTGLTGKYDFTLAFDAKPDGVIFSPGITPREGAQPDARVAADPTGLPGLFTALERQLGLMLVKEKAILLEVVIIDHAEKRPIE